MIYSESSSNDPSYAIIIICPYLVILFSVPEESLDRVEQLH